MNIGAGKWDFGRDWHHIDIKAYDHIYSKDLCLTSFDAESIDLIYSSHLIAYFTKDEVTELFRYWLRALKPGGKLQIGTPDFKAIAECYQQEHFPVDALTGPIYGFMNGIHHKTIYDLNKLSRLLHECGFDQIKQIKTGFYSEFKDQSWAYLPDRNYEDGNLISLNIECYKA